MEPGAPQSGARPSDVPGVVVFRLSKLILHSSVLSSCLNVENQILHPSDRSFRSSMNTVRSPEKAFPLSPKASQARAAPFSSFETRPTQPTSSEFLMHGKIVKTLRGSEPEVSSLQKPWIRYLRRRILLRIFPTSSQVLSPSRGYWLFVRRAHDRYGESFVIYARIQQDMPHTRSPACWQALEKTLMTIVRLHAGRLALET